MALGPLPAMYKFMASIASNGFGVWGVFTSGLGTFEGSSSTLQSLQMIVNHCCRTWVWTMTWQRMQTLMVHQRRAWQTCLAHLMRSKGDERLLKVFSLTQGHCEAPDRAHRTSVASYPSCHIPPTRVAMSDTIHTECKMQQFWS